MSIKRSFVAFAVLLLIAGGCKQRQQTASTNASSNNHSVAQAAATPEQLGELGAKIKRQPNDAHRLLQENGLNEQSFAAAIRKVSEDPAAAKRYAAAYKQGNG